MRTTTGREEFEVYEHRVIGRGETGILCCGRQLSERRAVTIKLLRERVDLSSEDLLRCQREVELLERLKSENVHRVIGTGVWKERTFFALEALEGELLSHLIRGGSRFDTDEILHVGEGVARALQAAWSSGIVHGAIRPSNIFLTSDGTVKVSGFGTKRCQEARPESPSQLAVLRYLAPEQWFAKPLDVQSDLYSLGVVLYELATGKPPFDGFDSATSLQYQMAYVDPPSPRAGGSLIPPELDRLIMRCLEKSPSRRIPTPKKFVEELAGIHRSSKTPRIPKAPSDDLGDFEVFEDQIVGEGGMGTLYRGKQRSLERPVAIKVIRGIFTGNPECVQRFRREGELLAEINDPTVVQVFGTGTWRGRLFYAMELVEGADLAAILDQGRKFSSAEILDIAGGVARALRAAWKFKIVHRDIKPSNILITPDQRIKVADFGLAKSLRIPRTDSKLLAGTSEYLSPQQAVGQNVDIRSDLYSLGIVMYELVAGRTPFRGDGSQTGVIYQHVYEAPPPVWEFVPEVPRSLARLIHRCLRKNPQERPADPECFLGELEEARRELSRPVSPVLKPSGTSILRRAGRWWRQRRWTLAAGAGLLALGGIVGLRAMLAPGSAHDPRGPSIRKTYDLAVDLGDFPSALKIAESAFGRNSREFRNAQIGIQETRILEDEREARACVHAMDWEAAAAHYRKLLAQVEGSRKENVVRAEAYCRDLAEGRRLEREGLGAAALQAYRRLRDQGSPHEDYLNERIRALEDGAELGGPPGSGIR
jgi:serine/threonine protein kinase